METKVFHAVLEAFGAGTSIHNGLERDTDFGTVQAVQQGTALRVYFSEPRTQYLPYSPSLMIENVDQVPSYVITATIRLMFHT